MNSVIHVDRCRLVVGDARWPWADARSVDVDRHWEAARRSKPGYFDGRIFMLRTSVIRDGMFEAEFAPTRFRKYLYWRSLGFPRSGFYNSFGSALIRSAEGHVLLGRQGPGNVNAGLAYPPSGFIDEADVQPDSTIDIDASVAREVGEETGFGPSELVREPGYHVVLCGPLVSIVCPYRSALSSADLAERMAAHIADDPDAELVEPVIVTGAEDRRTDIPDYTRVLLDWLF